MLDDLHSEGLGEAPRRRPDSRSHPLIDREVPLGSPGSTLAESVQAWLDGDLPESNVRRGETSRDVEFWKRLEQDLVARRRVKTPAYLQARIMDALPQHTPQMITPFWHREFVVTPANALLAAVTLVAVAAATTMITMRLPR